VEKSLRIMASILEKEEHMLLRRSVFLIALVGLSLLIPGILFAQEYPTKPVTLIIPYGPGGGHDLLFRAVTSVATDYFGQPILVKLMPGGGGAIAADFASKAAPDGYILFAGGNTPNSALPAVEGRGKGPDQMEPVCRVNYNSGFIATRPDAAFKTWKQAMEWMKANPGKLIVGTQGPWSPVDVVWKYFMKVTGVSVRLVHFDGGGPVIIALLGGHIDVCSFLPSLYRPYKNTGKIVPLLAVEDTRFSDIPDIPTTIEEGIPEASTINMLSRSWRGVMAPKGTPPAIIDKVATAFKKMTEDKSVNAMIQRYGDQIHYLGPKEFSKVWKTEFELYKELGKSYKK
jgi:tripartite-type tricarboxylate transporter receptor subunit TctC